MRLTLERLAVTALVAGAACVAAHGQGTSGSLPDPISSRDLARYADMLELSDEQRQAIEPLHEHYRDAFRQLRETEIEEFLATTSTMWGRGFRGLDVDAVRDSLDQFNRVAARINLIDQTLFNEIQAVLTEEQVAHLTRVMQGRERQRYQTGGTRMVGYVNRAARIDVSDLWDDLELSDEERQLTEPFILQYEERLTGAARKLYVAASRIFLNLAEIMAEQQAALADAPQDEDARRRLRESMTTAWADASKEARNEAGEISELNMATVRSLAEVLSDESAATLRARYLVRGYPEVPTGPGAAEISFRQARRIRDLTEAQRNDVEVLKDQFHADRDAIIDEIVRYVDKYRREWTPGSWRGEDRETHEAKLEAYKQRLVSLDEQTVAGLHAVLGAELARMVRGAVAEAELEEQEERAAGLGGARGGGDAEQGAAGSTFDPFLPPPIGTRDVARYRERLSLDDNDRFILEALYEEYWDGYKRIASTDIDSLRRAKAAMPKPDPQENAEAAPTVEQIDDVFNLRARALGAIVELDGTFFDDLETLVTTAEQQQTVQRLRQARQRVVYNRGLESSLETVFSGRWRRGRSSFESRGRESDVDLAATVAELDLAAEQLAKVDEVLWEYETAAVNAFRDHMQRVTRLRWESEKLNAQRAGADDNDRDRWRTRMEAFRKLMETEGRQASEARKTLIDLNRSTLAALTEALGGETGDALAHAYNVAAFPTIYQDPQAAGRFLDAAMELPDLAGEQRSKIETIIDEYRPANREVADRMAEIYAAAEDELEIGFDRSRWRAYQERRNQLDALQFDLDEVNAKALRQLRTVLDERQTTRIALPEEKTEEEET